MPLKREKKLDISRKKDFSIWPLVAEKLSENREGVRYSKLYLRFFLIFQFWKSDWKIFQFFISILIPSE